MSLLQLEEQEPNQYKNLTFMYNMLWFGTRTSAADADATARLKWDAMTLPAVLPVVIGLTRLAVGHIVVAAAAACARPTG